MKEKYVTEYSNHTKKDFEDVYNIEAEYLDKSTISSVEQVMSWDAKNSDIHIFVKDVRLDRIVGEITLLPVSKEQFDDFMENKLEDTQINAENLLVYEENSSYYLLFSAIAIDKEYREDKLVLSYLLKGLNTKINSLLGKGIKLKNMCAEGVTKEGQKFIEGFLDLKERLVTKQGYRLYCFDSTDDMNNWINKFPLYIEKYDSTIKQ